MVQTLSKIKVADNSGARLVQVIHVLGGKKGRTFQRFGSVGDLVSCSIKRVLPNSNFKKGDVVHGVIVRVRKEYRRNDGTYIRFDENAVALVNKETKEPKGTRIFGPIAREVKDRGYSKVISLAPEVL